MPGFESNPQAHLPDPVQIRRRTNLRLVIAELEADGMASTVLIDDILGFRTGGLLAVESGAEITDSMAREIEWAMNRPHGWMDRNPAAPDI